MRHEGGGSLSIRYLVLVASDRSGRATAWLTWLRAISILAVVTIHATGSTAAAPGAWTHPVGMVAVVVDVASHFAVPVFVLVSGALNLDPAKYRGARDFLRRRALRLVPAIVFWHLWYVGVRALRGDVTEGGDIARRIFVGELFTQLYFFWIILGLSAITPLLMPLIRRWGRPGAAALGAVALTGTIVAAALRVSMEHVQTALLWWLPYLGYYLLGWVLRDVRLRGRWLVLAGVATGALAFLLPWQWGAHSAPQWLQAVAPVSYYGAGMALFSIGMFLVAHALLAPDGVLRGLLEPPAMPAARAVGDATLGIFGFHMTVLTVLDVTGFLGGGEPATDVWTLLARVLLTAVVTCAVVLPLRRVPVVRAVL